MRTLRWIAVSTTLVACEASTEPQSLTIPLAEMALANSAEPVHVHEINHPWGQHPLYNTAMSPSMLFQVALDPGVPESVRGVIAKLHLYNVEPGSKVCTLPSGNYVWINPDVSYKKSYEQIVAPERPLVFRLDKLPEGTYRWHMTFKIVFKDGSTLFYPAATLPQSGCGLQTLAQSVPSIISNGYYGYFAVTPVYTDATYTPLFQTGNDANDRNRFNIVFYVQNPQQPAMTADEMRLAASHAVGGVAASGAGGEFGFLDVEPYRSNRNKFNFWVHQGELPSSAALNAGTSGAFELALGQKTFADLAPWSKILLSFPFDGARVVPIWFQGSTVVGGKTCGWNNGALVQFPINDYRECRTNGYSDKHCLDISRADRVLTHELAHIVGGADENYFGEALFDPAAFAQFYPYEFDDHFNHYATFYSPYVDANASCTAHPWAIECYNPANAAVADCEAHASWRDLLGNGCGEPGIIDCEASDPLSRYEVRCDQLGSGRSNYLASDLFRATKSSIMSDRYHFLDWTQSKANCVFGAKPDGTPKYSLCKTAIDLHGRVFGLANERQLCVFLAQWTGRAGGTCDDLCLNRCADGERCIERRCQ